MTHKAGDFVLWNGWYSFVIEHNDEKQIYLDLDVCEDTKKILMVVCLREEPTNDLYADYLDAEPCFNSPEALEIYKLCGLEPFIHFANEIHIKWR